MYEADDNGFRATGAHFPVSPVRPPPFVYLPVHPMIPVSGFGYRYGPQNNPFFYSNFLLGGRKRKQKYFAFFYPQCYMFSQFFRHIWSSKRLPITNVRQDFRKWIVTDTRKNSFGKAMGSTDSRGSCRPNRKWSTCGSFCFRVTVGEVILEIVCDFQHIWCSNVTRNTSQIYLIFQTKLCLSIVVELLHKINMHNSIQLLTRSCKIGVHSPETRSCLANLIFWLKIGKEVLLVLLRNATWLISRL